MHTSQKKEKPSKQDRKRIKEERQRRRSKFNRGM